MKKIATITFHNAINIGAVLQTYALQRTISSMGFETEVIDYKNRYLERAYSPFFLKYKTPTWILKTLIVAPVRIMRNQRFAKFNKQFIKLSKPIKTDLDFAKINNDYTTFLVGSDQVWNPYLTGKVDGRYFLDFVTNPEKKKSYAASFGLTELPDDFIAQYKKYLSDFSNISVREQTAISIVEELNGTIQPKLVLDPVFLLNVSEWDEIAINPSRKDSRYLLIFCVSDLTEDILNHSAKLAQEHKLKIIYLARRPQYIKGVKVVIRFAPREFLGYIKNAEHVVTDSFHAMSFSILFHKQFSLRVTTQHGLKNNRPLELLERLDIKGRTIGEKLEAINWNVAEKKLYEQKTKSLKYLKDSIGNHE